MDIRELTPTFAVSPQILPEDLAHIAAAGYTTILCNRPDGEIPTDICADEMQKAASDLGLRFVINPLVHGAMTQEIVAVQRDTIADGGKTLAYCASGTRSTVCWLLGAAGNESPDSLLRAAAQAGYDLGALRPQLEAIAAQSRT